MPKVCFLIPASPTPGFLSQIAAFDLALRRLTWQRWQPSILACFGEEVGEEHRKDFARWRDAMPNVAAVFCPPSAENTYYYDQIDGLLRWAPRDADVLVRADADTLPVGCLEGVLDFVADNSAIAGTIAHYRFPSAEGVSNRDAWLAVSEGFASAPLRFDYSYSLADPRLSADERATPFYLNDGFVFVARNYFERFAPLFLDIRPRLMNRLQVPYFAGQIALALAVATIPLPAFAAPLRYNFPNDAVAAARYPEELENAAVFHYLRTDEFDRQKIFLSTDEYARFLAAPLNRPNAGFRDGVVKLFGTDYPFAAVETGSGKAHDTVAPRTAEVDVWQPVTPSRPAAGDLLAAEREMMARYTKFHALEPMMKAKQSLVAKLGIDAAFTAFSKMMDLSDTVRINRRSLAGQADYARQFGETIVETHPGGTPFRIAPSKIVGQGTCAEFRGISRATHLSCIRDAYLRGGSALIETGRHALLDFYDRELDWFDCEYDIDPSVFSGDRHSVWVISGEGDSDIVKIPEAFSLLGPQLGAFGDFMVQYLPRYIWAEMSGALPAVPVLVNLPFPPTIERAIRLMLPPGVEMVKVRPFQPVHVGKLWCASSVAYSPSREIMDERYSSDHQFPAPHVMMPVVREIRRRAAVQMQGQGKGERIYLARHPSLWRKLVNAPDIEAIARCNGFSIVYPETLSFDEQVAMVANARHVILPEGSAVFLCYFAKPGTRICILQHPIAEGTNIYGACFDGCDVTILTGPFQRRDPVFPHRSDYSIELQIFDDFVARWTAGAPS